MKPFNLIPPRVPLVDAAGEVVREWWRWFNSIQDVTDGGQSGTIADLAEQAQIQPPHNDYDGAIADIRRRLETLPRGSDTSVTLKLDDLQALLLSLPRPHDPQPDIDINMGQVCCDTPKGLDPLFALRPWARSDWNGGYVASIGSGLTLIAGVLAATAGGGGTVTQIVAGSGLAGGTITTAGTVSLGTIAASSLMGNAGTAAAVPGAISVGANLTLTALGTLNASAGGSGSVTTVATTGAGISGGPITTTGTLSVEWNGGTVLAIGGEFVEPSNTLHYDQMPTYISASATIDTTYFGKNLVDNSAGASDVVLTLTTLAAGTHLTFVAQNNSAAHYVRLRPGTGVTINGVPTSDYLLPNFTGGMVEIDSTGTGYTTGSALSFWNPSAGYVTGLNGLHVTNNGTPATNGTLAPVVDGTSIILSGGTISATGTAAVGSQYSAPIGAAFSTVNSLGDATSGNMCGFFNAETIYSVYWPLATVVSGGSYVAQIMPINGSNVVQSIATSGTVIPSSISNRMLKCDFAGGVVVSPGTTYAISLTRLDGGNTYVLPVVYSGSGNRAWMKNMLRMGDTGNGIFQNATTAMANGTTLTGVALGFYGMALDKTF